MTGQLRGLIYRHVCDHCQKMEEGPVQPGHIVVDPPKGWVTVIRHDGTQGGVFARYVLCSYACTSQWLARVHHGPE